MSKAGYHDGEKAVQTRAGVRHMAERVQNGIHARIPPAARDFLLAQPFAVLGAADEQGNIWASLVAGQPGFLRPESDTLLHVHALPLPTDPLRKFLVSGVTVNAGLLVLEPATRRRMRLNGEASVLPDDQGFQILAAQVYANCPKYIQKREAQTASDAAQAAPAPAVSAALTGEQANFIRQSDTFFIATLRPGFGADASHRGGNPGFVHVGNDGKTLCWPDYAGNAMFNTLGNIEAHGQAGLLFLDWQTGDVLQLTGNARVLWDSDVRAAGFPDAERAVWFEAREVRHTPGTFPGRYQFGEYSPFNPPV